MATDWRMTMLCVAVVTVRVGTEADGLVVRYSGED